MKSVKNYTSSVPVERTVARIEQTLSSIGVERVVKNYANGSVIGLEFSITIEAGKVLTFRLPVRLENSIVAIRNIPAYKRKPTEWIKAQACRTAWKIMQDWIEIQVTLVQLGQAEALEVFLPFLLTKNGSRLYDRISRGEYRLLEGGE